MSTSPRTDARPLSLGDFSWPTEQESALQPQALPAAPSNLPSFFAQDGFDAASASADDDSPPDLSGGAATVRQDSATDCGAAAVTTLVRGFGKEEGKSDQQVMNRLDAQFTNGQGTTPEQLSKMLSSEGLQATHMASTLDKNAMDAALEKNDKVVALVDSNKIRPGGEAQGQGALHWVVIDKAENGNSENGNYRIKDPSDGGQYAVDSNKIFDAMNSAWLGHNGGGMMVVHDTASASGQDPTAESPSRTAVLGTNGGIGSNAKSFNIEG